MAGHYLNMMSQCKEIWIPLCSSPLCLRSRSASTTSCAEPIVDLAISSTWVTAFSSTRPWRMSKPWLIWSMSFRLSLWKRLPETWDDGERMELNAIGLVAAASTFVGVWFGHVAVRKIESIARTIWLPTASFAAVGVIFEALSLLTSNSLFSTAFGILSFTLLWDALEFTRQQNRIKKGYAPANPNNPRHARLMREHLSATTLDLLKRDPIGKPVSHPEAVHLITEH